MKQINLNHEYEVMENKISAVEYFASQENTSQNRSEIHKAYRSALAKAKYREADGHHELAQVWLQVAAVILDTAKRLNPEFKIRKRK